MSSTANSSKSKSLESKAVAIEREISEQGSSNADLKAAISSAELYMQALKLTNNAVERRRLDLKCKELLAKAESIKAAQDGKPAMAKAYPGDMKQPKSTRKLTTRENIILLEGSKLNGAMFKPWTQAPTKVDFELKAGEQLYLEQPHLPLSAAQQRSFAGWRRPNEALGLIVLKKNGTVLSNNPTMLPAGKIDLVQDMASDCSVVASLCAGTARAERGHPRILGSILYPYDYATDRIILSPNGKYVLRLYFNGCWRRVDIDDLLPTSKTSRVLHVIDRTHPGLLWPALMEKAYLKVRGGYDFPGSNSGTDLAVLIGWVPQQVFLHDEDIDMDELWDELYRAFEKGNMLLTIGTGKLPQREQKQLGLAAEHDYAVLELKSGACASDGAGKVTGTKEMLIKNPWSDGDVWIGAVKRRPNPDHEDGSLSPVEAISKQTAAQQHRQQQQLQQQRQSLTSIDGTVEDGHDDDGDDSHNDNAAEELMMPGTFWMDFARVFHHFENMYINWNPGLFTHRQDLHFSWQHVQDHTVPVTPNVFVDNPQFSVRLLPSSSSSSSSKGPDQEEDIWLWLNRHFRTGDYTHANSGKNGYICLYLFAGDGTKVFSSEGVMAQGHFVDSPNTLLRFKGSPNKAYTAVVVSQDLPMGKHNFTLSAFANSSISLEDAQPKYPSQMSLAAAWTRNTAGGNSDSIRYLSNPQFNFPTAADDTKVALVLRVTSDPTSDPGETNVHVKLLVVHNPSGRRVTKVRPRDIVVSSGDYRRGSAVIETTLPKGTYAVICSTFEENQLAKFQLDLHTATTKAILTPIPSESSGRLSIMTPPAILPDGTDKLIAPLTLPRLTRAIFIARAAPTQYHGSSTPSAGLLLFRLSLQRGQGPYAEIIASSADDNDDNDNGGGSGGTGFSNAVTGLRIEDRDLNPRLFGPDIGGLWLVLERSPGQTSMGSGGSMSGEGAVVLEVEILAEERIQVGEWRAVHD